MSLEYRADNPKNPKYPNEDTAFVRQDDARTVYVTQSGKIFVVRYDGVDQVNQEVNPLPAQNTPTPSRVRVIQHPDISE